MAGRVYHVTPWHPIGKKGFLATFVDAAGKRVTRGLGTDNQSEAEHICAGIARLVNAGAKTHGDVPADMPLKSRPVELYFHEARLPAAERDIDWATILREQLVAPKPNHTDTLGTVLSMAVQYIDKIESERATLRLDLAQAQRDRDQARADLKALQTSAIGRAVDAAKHAAPIGEALDSFREHLRSSSTAKHAAEMLRVVDDFRATLPATVEKTPEISVAHVTAWLDEYTARGNSTHRAYRRKAARIAVGRWLNWGARQWGYPSQMLQVPAVSQSAVDRERGEIRWHSQAEVEAVVNSLPLPYWRALVATLAYAGLQLAELVWLRRADVDLEKGQVWVTTVEESGERHDLKTGHRRRAVAIHRELLLPRLQVHLADGAGDVFVFPARGRSRRGSERWLLSTLSTVLRGHHGGRDLKKRPATPGLLPKGMTAQSLRRTFGSLLLRSGKTTAEVAGAMGNTEAIVRRHYARILGGEVAVDF